MVVYDYYGNNLRLRFVSEISHWSVSLKGVLTTKYEERENWVICEGKKSLLRDEL